MFDFILNYYNEVLAIIGGVVTTATAIVSLTPTTKDNEVLDKIISCLEKLSLYKKSNNKQ